MRKETEKSLIEKSLKRLHVFRGLSDRHLNQLVNGFHVRHVEKGETVFYQTDNCTDLYIILKGKVRASLLDESGDELILTTFGEGEFFGEMSVLDGRPRSTTIITEEDSTFGLLKREMFLSTVKNDPMIAIDLLAVLVQRLRMTDEMIGSLAFLDVAHRLIKLLLQIAGSEGKMDGDGCHRIKKITHKELATRIGASRESVTKALKILTFKKVIGEGREYFLISPSQEKC